MIRKKLRLIQIWVSLCSLWCSLCSLCYNNHYQFQRLGGFRFSRAENLKKTQQDLCKKDLTQLTPAMNQKQMLEKNKNKNKQTNPSPQNFVRGYSINVTNQNLDSLGKAKNSMPQNFQLEKPTKRVFFINLFLFQLGIINFVILTYFYMQQDISFRATGWFPIPENIHWYHIFLVLILVRMLIVFITHHLTEYIKNFSLWTEKKKEKCTVRISCGQSFNIAYQPPFNWRFLCLYERQWNHFQ